LLLFLLLVTPLWKKGIHRVNAFIREVLIEPVSHALAGDKVTLQCEDNRGRDFHLFFFTDGSKRPDWCKLNYIAANEVKSLKPE
jgi:hypothetical protein